MKTMTLFFGVLLTCGTCLLNGCASDNGTSSNPARDTGHVAGGGSSDTAQSPGGPGHPDH